ncbi:hypothetical protein G647_02214 [Cladophialophora carrionii CBS 160.54]|uniref:Uncharacterized protein n=1 Tax=Cladophialophora carrionii CBS 160.54 TaxID=1279043 RepID=V9DFL3_9EURO|nr:uncharacterized protein G647_02214 [Cladophialophora carrionii CBS 160.54]ETI25441.1 hypothetical protein G647_02214 [Cladophialophora carrionii CBS 160.54]
MDANRPNFQADRPTQLTDLPNEVIDRICEYLVVAQSQLKPFRRSEIKSIRSALKIEGWDSFGFIAGIDRCTGVFRWLDWFGTVVPAGTDAMYFGVLTQPSRARTKSKNSLAKFAATCQRFSSHARTLYARRTFTLTISNSGITFEGLRDASPLQTFSVLPKDQASLRPGAAMIDPASRRIVKVPKNTLPGNIAFGCFSKVFKSLRLLQIHVNVDLASERNQKTKFFLGQLGGFLVSHPRDSISLSTLEVIVNLGFYELKEYAAAMIHYPFGFDFFPEVVAFSRRGIDVQGTSISEAAVPEVSTTLATLNRYVQQFLTKQGVGWERGPTGPDVGSLKTKTVIRGDGTEWMHWGKKHKLFLSANTYEFGTFNHFCDLLQRQLYGSSPTAENSYVDGVPFVCNLGLPLPQVPTARPMIATKGRKRAPTSERNSGGLDLKNSKKRRLG